MNQGLASVGSVVSLFRYPVKSMLGEELSSAYISERGLLGDRAYALIDPETGKAASAKNPRKWKKLFDLGASFVRPPRASEEISDVRIALPDGVLVSSDQEIDRVLSKVLGREVKLAKANLENPILEEYWPDIEGLARRATISDESMPPRTFFDSAVIHLLTTSTLRRLEELYPEGRFEPRRFRPNLVIGSPPEEKGFIEDTWVGRTLAIGEELRLKITGPCYRCVMTTLAQGDLPSDLGILRTVAKFNEVHVGVYASVVRAGSVHPGDPVLLDR